MVLPEKRLIVYFTFPHFYRINVLEKEKRQSIQSKRSAFRDGFEELEELGRSLQEDRSAEGRGVWPGGGRACVTESGFLCRNALMESLTSLIPLMTLTYRDCDTSGRSVNTCYKLLSLASATAPAVSLRSEYLSV